jgi:hypothetical protein
MGATSSGFNLSITSGGKISWVNREAANGAMVFTLILCLSPSNFKVFIKPTKPILAAE